MTEKRTAEEVKELLQRYSKRETGITRRASCESEAISLSMLDYYLWRRAVLGGETVFDFQLGRDRAGPKKFLEEWQGIFQTDGYSAYDRVGGPKLVHVGCWPHARRKFVDAVKVPQDAEAIKMVTSMDALFLVDRHARDQQLHGEKRLAFRREHALPWVGGRN